MQLRDATTLHRDNKKCPKCDSPMEWTEGLLRDGARDISMGRYSCPHCLLFEAPKESRATQKGRELAHDLIGVDCMSRAITGLSIATQIGILRERQHCTTCDNALGEPCTCKGKCDCLYCREHR